MNLANMVGVSPQELIALTLIASGHNFRAVSRPLLEQLQDKGLLTLQVSKKGVELLNTVRPQNAKKSKS